MSIDEQDSKLLPGFNRFFLNLPAENNEYVWGGGEQYTYFNLREGPTYPIWTREQGVGRNKSSLLTQVCHSHKIKYFNLKPIIELSANLSVVFSGF